MNEWDTNLSQHGVMFPLHHYLLTFVYYVNLSYIAPNNDF